MSPFRKLHEIIIQRIKREEDSKKQMIMRRKEKYITRGNRNHGISQK
jgi:hypothetical protein